MLRKMFVLFAVLMIVASLTAGCSGGGTQPSTATVSAPAPTQAPALEQPVEPIALVEPTEVPPAIESTPVEISADDKVTWPAEYRDCLQWQQSPLEEADSCQIPQFLTEEPRSKFYTVSYNYVECQQSTWYDIVLEGSWPVYFTTAAGEVIEATDIPARLFLISPTVTEAPCIWIHANTAVQGPYVNPRPN